MGLRIYMMDGYLEYYYLRTYGSYQLLLYIY